MAERPIVMAASQSYGVVLFVDDEHHVRHVTRGCAALLGRDEMIVVGQPVSHLLPSLVLASAPEGETPPRGGARWQQLELDNGTAVSARPFAAGGGLTGIDVVPALATEVGAELATVNRIAAWNARLQTARTRGELLRTACDVALEVTGFEGFWAVRLQPDGDGYIEAASVTGTAPDTTGSTARADTLPPGDLGSADDPDPFFVADVVAEPVGLEPSAAEDLLAASTLCRPYPEYLGLMASLGIRSTCSIPVVVEGRTWGRLVGHKPVDDPLTPATQAELRLVGRAAGIKLQELLEQERADERLATAIATSKIVREVVARRSLRAGFEREHHALLDLLGAPSAIVRVDRSTTVLGAPLSDELVAAILKEARLGFAGHDHHVTSSTSLPGGEDGPGAGGYLALRFDEAATDLVAWVRPAQPRTVQWIELTGRDPSASDEPWTLEQAVASIDGDSSRTSTPWTPDEIEVAENLHAELASATVALQGAFRAANLDLQSAHTEFDAFAHTVAHELRAPIRAMAQYVEFVLEDASGRLTGGEVDGLTTVLRLADRGTTLLDDLARFADLGDGTWTVEAQDLRTAVDDAVQHLGEEALGGAQLTVEAATITADRSALLMLLAQLIHNSALYSDGPADIRIGVGSLTEAQASSQPPPRVRGLPGHTPVLIVEDAGIGIAPEHTGRVFGLFKRANEAMPHIAGSGAGLAMCQRIAQRHGGDIWLTSTPKAGTTVYAVLAP